VRVALRPLGLSWSQSGLISETAAGTCTLVLFAVLLTRLVRVPLIAFGVRKPTVRDLEDGLLWALGIYCVARMCELAFALIDRGPVNLPFDRHTSPREWIALVVLIGIVGPLNEEILFRGFFANAFSRFLGAGPALVLTSVLFAGSHLIGLDHELTLGLVVEEALPLAIVGFLLGLAYWRKQSLWTAIAAHVGFNCMTLLTFAFVAT
jgi:membrane protease YdiL (CAAX protease family)